MNKSYILIIGICLILLSGCVNVNCIRGSGNIGIEERTIPQFDSIKIEGQGELTYTQGELTKLTIETDDNILKEIETYVVGTTLIIDANKCFRKDNPIKIEVGSENLKEIDIYGSGKIKTNELNLESLDISTIGAGELRLKGKIQNMDVKLHGSGELDNYELNVNNLNLDIEGSGKAKVKVESTLDIDIKGSGEVYYRGNPKITQVIAGSGKIENVEDTVSISKNSVEPTNPKLGAIDCLPEQRNVDACIEIYQPVCGQMQVECITAPCDLVKETFENSCKACSNERVISYTEGECQTLEDIKK